VTHVVTENCQQCRYTECVTTCPVACFHGDEQMLYIDPVECIDCGACVPACPVQAIFSIYDLPPEKEAWTAINAERSPKLPVVKTQQEPLPGADAKRAELGL
jgi:ferredoxin